MENGNYYCLKDSEAFTKIQKNQKLSNGYSPVRLTSLRHNPYVGSFHGVKLHLDDEIKFNNVMSESKNNPLVGLFRHSPSSAPVISEELGLKGIILQSEQKKNSNIINQLQISRQSIVTSRKAFEMNFLHSIRKIPSKVYSQSQSSESNSPQYQNSDHETSNQDKKPLCSICIESYEEGDEFLTLACQHCFHNECITKWFYQSCLERGETKEFPFNCPECRQDHIFNDNTSTSGKHNEVINKSILSSSYSIINVDNNTTNNDNNKDEKEKEISNIKSNSNNSNDNNNNTKNDNIHDNNKEDEVYEISHQSFLHIGANVLNECGYDFLSDFGSDLHESPTKIKSTTTAITTAYDINISAIHDSQYSDCGTPLAM